MPHSKYRSGPQVSEWGPCYSCRPQPGVCVASPKQLTKATQGRVCAGSQSEEQSVISGRQGRENMEQPV